MPQFNLSNRKPIPRRLAVGGKLIGTAAPLEVRHRFSTCPGSTRRQWLHFTPHLPSKSPHTHGQTRAHTHAHAHPLMKTRRHSCERRARVQLHASSDKMRAVKENPQTAAEGCDTWPVKARRSFTRDSWEIITLAPPSFPRGRGID